MFPLLTNQSVVKIVTNNHKRKVKCIRLGTNLTLLLSKFSGPNKFPRVRRIWSWNHVSHHTNRGFRVYCTTLEEMSSTLYAQGCLKKTRIKWDKICSYYWCVYYVCSHFHTKNEDSFALLFFNNVFIVCHWSKDIQPYSETFF